MLALAPLVLAALFALPARAAAQAAARADTARLDTVRVSVASRTGASLATPARTVDVIDRAEIERTAARTIADVLATQLGVDILPRSPAQADLSLRGSSVEQVLVMVDGVPVSDVQAGHYDLDLAVPLAMVERIEVLRGTGSTLYGSDAVGGVVNIVTRTDARAASLRARGGSFGTAGASLFVADTTGGLALRVGADGERSDGHRADTDYRIGEGRVSLEHALGAGRLRADLGIGVRGFGAADFYGSYPSYERTNAGTAALRWDLPLGARWSLAATLDARRHTDVFTLFRDDPSIYQNHHTSWQRGSQVVARWAAAPGLAIAVGAEGRDDRLTSDRLGDHVDDRGALFGEATLGRPGHATLDAGLRGDWSSVDGAFASPSLAAALPLASWVTARGSVSRGFRAPTWTERYYADPANVGNPALRPERFWAEELGVRLFPAWRVSVDVALFERRANALIDWAKAAGAPDSEPWHAMNVGAATYRGAELEARVPNVLGTDWVVRASALSFDARGDAGYTGKYALDPVTRSLGVSATRAIGARARIGVDVLGTRRAEEESYVRTNARVAWRIGDAWLRLDALNIGDSRHVDASGVPMARRAWYFGVATPIR